MGVQKKTRKFAQVKRVIGMYYIIRSYNNSCRIEQLVYIYSILRIRTFS